MSQTNNTDSPIDSDALVLPLRVIDLDSPFFFGVGRDMTFTERMDAERHGRYDNPPMSVLGVTSEGLAAVEGEELAQMFAAAPDMLGALKSVVEAWENPEMGWIAADRVRAALAKASGENEKVEQPAPTKTDEI